MLLKSLHDNEIDLINKIADLYMESKSLVLYSEQLDPEFKSNINIINEYRNAFDHFMRVLFDIYRGEGSELKKNELYYKQNLDKVLGHIYRASYDALDGIYISLAKNIGDITNNYDPDTIIKAIPDYSTKRLQYQRALENISTYRSNKDIGIKNEEKITHINNYMNDLEYLKEYYNDVITCQPFMEEIKTAKEKASKKSQFINMKVKIAAGVILLIISSTVAWFMGKYTGASQQKERDTLSTKKTAPLNLSDEKKM